MPTDFKYSLTRVCLRAGQLTLPGTMLDLFPQDGSVTVFDTVSNSEYVLQIHERRKVRGLQEFFKQHHLDVNDNVLIRPLEDGRYAITPLPRPKKVDYSKPGAVTAIVERIASQGVPLSEAEIRAMHTELPANFDLTALFEADERFVFKRGRWQLTDEASGVKPDATNADTDTQKPAGKNKEKRISVTPYPPGVMFPGNVGLNSEQSNKDFSAASRARTFLENVGFRVEGLAHGQLVAHGDLGRRQYSALISVLPEGERLDWAALQARRRELNSQYLAVFGAHHDLIRLDRPAEMARATRWSWQALERVTDLTRTVLISPFDLESHFERDGLHEAGLERFERTIETRIRERGTFSSVLTHLSIMKTPKIFMLDEVVDGSIPRDQVLKVLELLSQAPFHLITKVDSGEFCLRYPVADGLSHLADYAVSLRSRLPSGRRERIQMMEDIADVDTMMNVESNG